ncbi:MAG: hypothetical protein N838_24085 [Thiohalocapsa sp. PB-PSB1]|nr:MAG: hypothetical protein N838_32060 [Thiohalocapsa sp. PB-PSB1]QQO55967.1 MAG: hypothetical protein N838_24085 [Thiohalocapsa sp. PB-PSB1]
MNVEKHMRKKQKKMSQIFKELALTVMKDQKSIPSSEAAHTALLLANAAWNRANGEEFTDHECKRIIRKFEKSRRSLWIELRSRDWKALINELIQYKNENYPEDKRIVVVCGMREGNIHVEWKQPPESIMKA